MTKKKWLLLLCGGLLGAIALLAVFWDGIVIYVAPKSVLTTALYDAMEDLQTRYEKSPVSMLAEYIAEDGQYTARMELNTEHKLLGPVTYDMTVQADTMENRLAADGVINTAQKELDMRLYLDRDFMSVSSGNLLGGTDYGITYATFPEDIRSLPLISVLIGESTLSEWEGSVADIQSVMNRSYRIPELPEISTGDIQRAMLAVMLLPSQVDRVEMAVWGVYDECYRISYSAKGDQVAQVLTYMMDTGDGSDAQLHASFYLYKEDLVMMQLNGQAGGNSIQCALEFMLDSATTRTLRYAVKEGGTEQGFCLRHEAQSNNGYLDESWTLYPDFAAEGEGSTLRYRWEPVMGELVLYLQPTVTLNVFKTDAGLNIQTGQFNLLMDVLSGEEPDWDEEDVSCNLVLQKGAQITTPTYKNISQWSLEDVAALLGNIGGLLGLGSL